MRPLLAPLLPSLVRLVLGTPRLKVVARRLLQAAPRLQARLQLMMARAAMAPQLAPRLAPLTAGRLSARACALHGQLTRVRTRATCRCDKR